MFNFSNEYYILQAQAHKDSLQSAHNSAFSFYSYPFIGAARFLAKLTHKVGDNLPSTPDKPNKESVMLGRAWYQGCALANNYLPSIQTSAQRDASQEKYEKKGLHTLKTPEAGKVINQHIQAIDHQDTHKHLNHARAATGAAYSECPQYAVLSPNQADQQPMTAAQDQALIKANKLLNGYNKVPNDNATHVDGLNQQLKTLHTVNKNLTDASFTTEGIRTLYKEAGTSNNNPPEKSPLQEKMLNAITINKSNTTTAAAEIKLSQPTEGELSEKERLAVLDAVTKAYNERQIELCNEIEATKTLLQAQLKPLETETGHFTNDQAFHATESVGYLNSSADNEPVVRHYTEHGEKKEAALTYKDENDKEQPLKLSNKEFDAIVGKWNAEKRPAGQPELKTVSAGFWGNKRQVIFNQGNKSQNKAAADAFTQFLTAEGTKLRTNSTQASATANTTTATNATNAGNAGNAGNATSLTPGGR